MKYILLRIEDDAEAQRFLEDTENYPDSPLLSPTQENTVYFTVARNLFVADDKPEKRVVDIIFNQSPVRSHGVVVSCSECGALISDWLFIKNGERAKTRPNQVLHQTWHEELVKGIAIAATAHLRGNTPLDYCLGCGNEVKPEDARGDQTCGDMQCIENVRSRL